MFKLVVLFALVAVAVAKPSGLALVAPAVTAYAAPVLQVVPGAVSHSYRSDVIRKPVVTAYTAPAVVAAPIALPAAVSHSYRSDVISKPWVASYSAPAVHHLAYAAHVPAIHAW
ncbi:hypothetical protein JTB14_014215 [Gonioctena quinquepunctata]|nr:hypothetical protein JTB14_014215 [Gonioctena quinquepunctata]